MTVCQTCGGPLPSREGRPGRSSVYCSQACRQKAYRDRQAPEGTVPALIAEIERRVKELAPRPPASFYADVNALASSVGQLRRIARVASDAARTGSGGIVTPAAVTEPLDEVEAVRSGDESTFAGLLEPHRRELQVHCYRMLGSYDDSEDLVQETFLRAWRNRDGFEGRATFRAWLYRIATNACLDFLRRVDRRPARYEPMPGTDPEVEPPSRVTWLQPYPDELASAEPEPDAAVVSRETMELVFLAAIQHLPPKQRAVLILRDVLGWPASETGQLLEMSVASVNSALQRARLTLRENLPERRLDWAPSADPTEEELAVLRRYMDAAARSDFAQMAELIAEDALLTMPPAPIWFRGRQAIMDFVTPVLDTNSPQYFGRWRRLLTRANGQLAAAAYVQRPGTAVYRAQVLDVLRIEGGRIVEIMAFEPHLFAAFGLPLTLRDVDR